MRRTIAFPIANWVCCSTLLTLGIAMATVAVSAASADDPAEKTPTKAELEKRFADSMSGVTMIGHYITGSLDKSKDLSEDRYEISKVTKEKDDTWIFNARIEVEGQDLTLPIPLKVLWAGDTPVITVEEISIPALGTFSARVLIHNHNYAGTWSHGDEGGQMFGRIEKTETKADAKPQK
ncbi:MAG TPA: hypothetical protein VHX65_06395 [Pirellulales bacterium]|jgi:hypothetical protein|nr:hypothetical protein [Pirellulales bacterium]